MNRPFAAVSSAFHAREWIVPAVFCVLMLAQLLGSARQLSQHADESTHLYSGYRILKCGDYAYGREHPPLAKVLAAFPLLGENAPLDCSAPPRGMNEAEDAVLWLYTQPNWWKLLSEARLAASLSPILLLLAVWMAARKLFGLAEAVLASALVAFDPNLLGHGALVLTDVLASAFFLLTVFAYYAWTQRRSSTMLLATGFVLGLALLTKNSSPILVFILAGIAVVEAWLAPGVEASQRSRRLSRNLSALVPVMLLAAVVIWAGYGFHLKSGERRASDNGAAVAVAGDGASVQFFRALGMAHLLPQAYLDGLIEARGLVKSQDAGIDMLGKHYSHGPWFAIPLTLSVQLTLGFWGILLLGIAGVILRGREKLAPSLAIVLPLLVYLGFSLMVSRNGGIRYLLPLLPLLAILAASGAVSLMPRGRWVGPAVLVLLAAHAVSSLAAAPNYLSYANEAWGGPKNLYRIFPSDSGQAYFQVREYLKQTPGTPCWVFSEYFMRPETYGVNCETMGLFMPADIPARMDGIVIVSNVNFAHYAKPGGLLSGFQNAQPVARLGGSAMLVFRGSFDTTSLVAREIGVRALALQRQGHPEEALPLAQQAVQLTPDSAFAHAFLGAMLMLNQRPAEAMAECQKGRAIALADENQQEVAAMSERLMRQISTHFGVPLPAGVPRQEPGL